VGQYNCHVAIERIAFFVPWPTGYTGSGVASPIYGHNRKVEIMETAQYFEFHDEPVSISS